MMISAEEMPADMTKERDELNQPKNRQSLQPFYSKVIAYLAEHAKMDKNNLLEWLKDQVKIPIHFHKSTFERLKECTSFF